MKRLALIAAFAIVASLPAIGVPAQPAGAAAFADGISDYAEGRYHAAMGHFIEAAQTPGADAEVAARARFMQGKALAACARFEDAVVVLDSFLEMAPDSPFAYEALMLRGQSLVAASASMPHFQEAAISFASAFECEGLSPGRRVAAAGALIDALLRSGDMQGGKKMLARLSAREEALLRDYARERNMRRILRFLERTRPDNA